MYKIPLCRERESTSGERKERDGGGGEIGRDSRRDEFPWITFSLFTRGCNQIRSCEKKKKIRGTIWLISMSRFNLGEHVLVGELIYSFFFGCHVAFLWSCSTSGGWQVAWLRVCARTCVCQTFLSSFVSMSDLESMFAHMFSSINIWVFRSAGLVWCLYQRQTESDLSITWATRRVIF